MDIKKNSWPINYIQIFNELSQREEILNFDLMIVNYFILLNTMSYMNYLKKI